MDFESKTALMEALAQSSLFGRHTNLSDMKWRFMVARMAYSVAAACTALEDRAQLMTPVGPGLVWNSHPYGWEGLYLYDKWCSHKDGSGNLESGDTARYFAWLQYCAELREVDMIHLMTVTPVNMRRSLKDAFERNRAPGYHEDVRQMEELDKRYLR